MHHVPTARRRRPGRILARILVPLVILGIAGAIALIVRDGLSRHPVAQAPRAAATRRLPPYWRVRAGDSFALIAAKTGLSVDQLQAYNPNVDPLALSPGERLNLWQNPPRPRGPKAKPGPMFWVVRPGQSFGSIAASTRIDITTLEQLNPNIPPAKIQPGDRVRLRH